MSANEFLRGALETANAISVAGVTAGQEIARRESAARIEALTDALRDEAAQLRKWALESCAGGWSTHQVDAMRRRADEIDAILFANARAARTIQQGGIE